MNLIIIIPSWYPTKDNLVKGSFFKEQAILFEDSKCGRLEEYKIRILLPNKRALGIFAYLYFKKALRQSATSDIEIVEPPEGHVFNYYHIVKPRWVANLLWLSKKWDIANFNILTAQVKQFITLNYDSTLIKVVHAHSVNPGGIISMIIKRFTGARNMITEHQLVNLNSYNSIESAIIRESFQSADYLLSVSSYLKQYLLSQGISRRISVVGNFINEEVFRIESARSGKIAGITVIYDDHIKGPEIFFEALKILKLTHRVRELRFLVVNGMVKYKENEDTLKVMAKRYGVLDLCEFFNDVPRGSMSNLFNQASFFVSSSLSETFGVAVCEAICCGLPVVATDSGGIRDFLCLSNGIVVEVGDANALAKGILDMTKRFENYHPHQMRSDIISKYGKRSFSNLLASFYTNLLKYD